MANTINYAEIFQASLDETLVPELVTRAMEANASLVKYSGGAKVQIPKLETTGLGNYSRANGFPSGAATLEWEERSLTMDRGISISIDAQDVDEGNFVDSASNVLGVLQKNKIAPEVDAYRFSEIYALAAAKSKVGTAYTPDKSSVYGQLVSDIATVQDLIGEAEQLDVYLSFAAAKALDASTEFQKQVQLIDFNAGGISTKVKSIDNIPLIRVPSARFKTAYTFSATDGFAATAGAKAINWIIIARRAPIAVVKTDKVRVFDPDTNQDADAWKLQTRKYHDLWIMDNKMDGVWVNIGA